MAGKQAADRAGEKAPAPIECARQALGRQPQREDEPEGREGDAVAHHVARGAAHPHRPRPDPLAPGEDDAAQHQQQEQVHDEVEHGLVFHPGREVAEKDVSLQGHVAQSEVGGRLDPSGDDQQEPPECEAHVHIPQQRIDAEDAAVEQRLADDLADGFERAARGQPPDKTELVGPGQAVEPPGVFGGQRQQHHRRADHERHTEGSEESHLRNPPVYVL